jgi:5'(3')-deoxyribonucleotidase
MKIFIDLDGVVADFTGHAAKQHGIALPEGQIPHHFLYETLTPKQFWSKCRGEEFWVNIPVFPWAQDLVNLVNANTKEWAFLTKANLDDTCYQGKARWIRKHFPKHTERLWIVRGDKHIAASQDCLLIDDHPENIAGWLNAGGQVFHWHEICEKSVDIAQKRLTVLEQIITK